MRIAIYGRSYTEEHFQVYNKIIDALSSPDCEISVHSDLWALIRDKFNFKAGTRVFSSHHEIVGSVDFLFSIGGDGTLLNTVTLVRDSGIPVLGFNTGRLGFLSSVNMEEIEYAIGKLRDGSFETEKRSLIRLESTLNIFGEDHYALNEVCLQRKDGSSMISINAYVNNLFLNTYWADGLIVATPTGSTAYSLSCGGPIMVPESEAFLLTPVSTHNLTVRPMVVPDSSTIRLKASGRESNFLVSLDSRSETIDTGTELTIRKADHSFNLVKLPDMNFFNTIREKLMWGMDRRN